MNDLDDDTFEQFARRLARIDAEVKDPPPFGSPRHAAHPERANRAAIARVVAALAVVAVVFLVMPLVGRPTTDKPGSSVAAAIGGGSVTPEPTVAPGASGTTVMVEGWPASCADVDPAVCEGVAALAINNLGRNSPSGPLAVDTRPICPAVPSWANPAHCWQVSTPVSTDTVCMVVAIRSTDGKYAQVAGDVPGRASLPTDPRGCPPGVDLPPLDPASPPEPMHVHGPCLDHATVYDRLRTTVEQDAARSTAVVIGTITAIGQAQWNNPGGHASSADHVGPASVVRFLRVAVDTVVRGAAPGVVTLSVPGGEIACQTFSVGGFGGIEVGSRDVFFLGDDELRIESAGVEQAWQVWPIDGGDVTTAFDGQVPLATFIARAAATP
jgi:hypothetical protein